MDVTFTNVLEGARQYFQGLPTGSSSTVSPAYSAEAHLRNNSPAYSSADQQPRNSPAVYSAEAHLRNDQGGSSSIGRASSNAYWPPQSQGDQGSREQLPSSHASVHRPASHGSDSSRPSSHSSQYAQNVPAEPSPRNMYTGSYQEPYHATQAHQQQQQQQTPQVQQQHHQLHQQSQQPQLQPQQSQLQQQHQQSHMQLYLQQPQRQQQQQSPSQQSPRLQQSPHPQPSPRSQQSPLSQQSPHPQQSPHLQQSSHSQQQFQFSRPHAREGPSNFPQYQTLVPAGSNYHQSPSPYHQVPSPQQPRAPSREQVVPRVPSREQSVPRVPSQEQLVPRASQREQQYPQASETYSYQQQQQQQSRSYYQQTSQPKTVPSGSTAYKTATQQSYPTSAHQQQQQQQQMVYYKHIYSPQQTHQSVYASSRQEDQTGASRGGTSSEQVRTTHNLPPIAALSNYHSSRSSSGGREPARPVSSTTSRTRTFSSSSYTSASASSIIQPNPAVAVSAYQEYRPYPAQQYQSAPSVTSPSYSQVIMTASSNSTSSYYSGQQYQQQRNSPRAPAASTERSASNPSDQSPNSRTAKPLDLSVKTVRTPADSTLGDADHDARNKYYQQRPAQTISAHNYPQLDVGSFQRNLTQRSAAQLPTATAPKVEFRPNFNVQALGQPRRPVEEPRHSALPEKAHSNSRLMPEMKSPAYRYPPAAAHANSYVQAAPKEPQKRRPSDTAPVSLPSKVPKVADTWRQSIDLQIEERLTSYKQQQAKLASPSIKPAMVNGSYQEKPKNVYPAYQSATPASSYAQYSAQTSHSQTYVPSPATTHQYSAYTGYQSQQQQPSNSYLQPGSRSNSASSLNSLGGTKSSSTGPVDKKVLSLLRNSLEVRAVKEQKKLEQQKNNETPTPQHLRSDVQHPSTDVTAPLQPKPGFVNRNNVSPFTPTSFPDSGNMASMYKFHIPKAIDSVNFESDSKPVKQTDTVINSIGSDYDGLAAAAFLAARIRTKGELKQGATQNVCSNNNRVQLQDIIEQQLKSPMKEDTPPSSYLSDSSTPASASPPKPSKDRQAAFVPRKRLFSRNEEDTTNHLGVPRRDPSGLRSSSETSVFDFPDSDSENDAGRESLEAMRKCRKTSKQSTPVADVKEESPPRVESPGDDMFAQLCDNFVEQLKSGAVTKKCKKKKAVEPEVLAMLESVTKEQPLDGVVRVKEEEDMDPGVPQEDFELPKEDFDVAKEDADGSKASDKTNEDVEKSKTVLEESKEDLEESKENIEVPKPEVCPVETTLDSVLESTLESIKSNLETEPESKVEDTSNDLASNDLITDVLIANESEIKEEDEVFLNKKKGVRRRLVSSSESETETTDKVPGGPETEVIKSDELRPQAEVSKPVEASQGDDNKESESPKKAPDVLSIARPSKKPCFGDGSGFYPGWEEGEFKYKKSLRMPPSLIQVSRPPQFHRLSTSLPDLDPCPQSPTTSIPTDDKDSPKDGKFKAKKVKCEPLESDTESNSGFNIFSRKTNYDSEGGTSVRSLPNTAKERSILDKLLEKCGGRKKKKYKRKDDHSPKVIPKADNPVELLATPSLEIKEEDDKETKKLSNSPVIKSESPLLGFRKSTINNFKDAFIKRSNNIVGVNEFTTVVLKSRTRRETRVQKQRATIKEVFGEDRPASAPPVTCLNDIQIKEEVIDDNTCLGNLVIRLEKKTDVVEVKKEPDTDVDAKPTEDPVKDTKKDDASFKAVVEKTIKTEVEDETAMEDDTRSLGGVTTKSETPSIDGDDGSISGRRRGKFGKVRRKLSSGFDYIRKKKKVKKENVENEGAEKKKKRVVISKTLESVDDIQKEIKTWVLNKGIGETHLHRAARLGFTDVTAYCLEKMESTPSPKDNAGFTPLHWACSKGHLQIAKLLLLYGANPSESAQGGIRPLHEAVENGFVEIARLLLSYGADPKLATYTGLTPLALTNDEGTKDFLKNHLNDIEGESSDQWVSFGPASVLDPADLMGYNHLEDVPATDPESEGEDVEFEMSETLLPNLYTLRNEPPADRWVLLQDLSGLLKVKSRDALLKQICPASSTSSPAAHKTVLRELKMCDFLEQAHCCQFLNAGEKINTRASKIALVKYTDKVKELLNVESVVVGR